MDSSNPLAALSGQLAGLAAAGASVTVAVHGRDGRPCSGILWRDGLIVTAEEALERDDDLSVVLPDGRRVAATLVGRDPGTDVALLRAETGPVTPLPAMAEGALVPGHLLLALGRVEDGPVAALGIAALVGGPWRSLRGGRLETRIRLDLRLDPAAEGGPVLDHAGQLLGMAVRGPRRRTLAIPAASIARVTEVLLAHGRVARGYLGVGFQPVQAGERRGLIAVGVDPRGPASQAGLLLGDVLVAWNGAPLASVREMVARLDPESVGSDVELELIRAGATTRLSVRVGERPAA